MYDKSAERVKTMTTKERILKSLLASDNYLSGEYLAEKLGVSRNCIWKTVSQLRDDGFEIEAVTNKGYMLLSVGNVLSKAAVYRHLGDDSRQLHIFDTIDSTNIFAKKLAADGAPHGTAVIAESQTAGKGRLGRIFCSPAGGSIYMSVVLRPGTDMQSSQLITSCMAAAAANAVDSVCGTDTKIKWVNDLFLNGRKISGILTEASINFESGTLDYAVVGIGINLKSVKSTFPPELLEIATSVEDETGVMPDRCRLIAVLLQNIDSYIADISSGNFLDEYRRRSFIIGQRVAVSKISEERLATAVDITDTAGLLVRYDDGSEEVLSSGEARIVKK